MLNLFCCKHMFAIAVAIAVMLNLSCRSSEYQLKGQPFDSSLLLADFRLINHTGEPFQWSKDMDGEIALLFFGYTYCPDVCPMTLVKLQAMLAEMPPHQQEAIRVILITADPERDTPAELANYLSFFDDDFIGLTGDAADIQAVVQALAAFAEKDTATINGAHYLVSHTARLYLLTPQGNVPVSYPFDFSPDDVRQDLAYLLEQN